MLGNCLYGDFYLAIDKPRKTLIGLLGWIAGKGHRVCRSTALGWPVKPDKAEATYEHGLLRIEVPFKDPMEGAVKIAIKAGGAETKTKTIEGKRK